MANKEVNIFVRLRDEATSEMKKIDAELKKWGTSFAGLQQVALASVAAVTGAAVSVGAVVKATADTGDALDEMSQKTGVSVEALSRLQYAAKFSSVDSEALGTAFKKLSVNMVEAGTKGDSIANQTFRSLGISVKDANGHLLASDAVMLKLADKFAGMKDGPAKTALAMTLMGKSGEAMIPFLNEGSAGIARMAKESDALGNTWTSTAAKDAAGFNDSLDRLTTAAKGGANAFGKELLPVSRDLMNTLVDLVAKNQPLIKFFSDAAAGAIMLANSMAGGKTDNGMAVEAEKVKAAWDKLQEAERSGNDQQVKLARQAYDWRLQDMRAYAAERKKIAEEINKQPTEAGGKTDAPVIGASPADLEKARSTIMAEMARLRADMETVSGNGLAALSTQQSKAIMENMAKEQEEKAKGIDLHKEHAAARLLIEQTFGLKRQELLEKQNAERLQIMDGLETQLSALTASAEQQRLLAADKSHNKTVESLIKAYNTGVIPTVEQFATAIETSDRIHAVERGKIATEEGMKRIAAEADTARQIAQLTFDLRLGGLDGVYQAEKQRRDTAMAQELADAEKNGLDQQAIKTKYQLMDAKSEQDLQSAKQQRIAQELSLAADIAQAKFQMGMGSAEQLYQAESNRRAAQMAKELQDCDQQESSLALIRDKYRMMDVSASDAARRQKEQEEARHTAAIKSIGDDLYAALGGRSRQAFEAHKTFATGMAIISTWQAATSALAAPPGPPWSYAYAAAAIVKGMAQVSQIQAQQPPAFREGGVVDTNTLFRAGEAGREAIVPLSGGRSIPVDLRGGSNGAQPQTVTIINVLDPSSFQPPPDAIINVINADIAANGRTRTTIRRVVA